MMTIERKDLVDAVLASRDALDADLETELLEAVVNAEADAAGDGATALRGIDSAVAAAIARGVGHIEPAPDATDGDVDAADEEDED